MCKVLILCSVRVQVRVWVGMGRARLREEQSLLWELLWQLSREWSVRVCLPMSGFVSAPCRGSGMIICSRRWRKMIYTITSQRTPRRPSVLEGKERQHAEGQEPARKCSTYPGDYGACSKTVGRGWHHTHTSNGEAFTFFPFSVGWSSATSG